MVDTVGILIPDAENDNPRAEGLFCDSQPSDLSLENNRLTFSTKHMLCVKVEMETNDYYTLRNETRFGPSLTKDAGVTQMAMFFDYLRNCDVPWPQRYNWYKAKLTIDGIERDNIGIRKRGFLGSTFSIAPSLNIRTEKNVTNNAYGETNRIILNNNTEDPSRLKSSINYKVLELAGYPAPKCNLANVMVNEELLGAYSHLQAVDDDFLNYHFGTSDGYLYEGTIVDFIDGRHLRWDAKSDEADIDRMPILQVTDALQVEDEDLEQELSKVLNIDRFITFWALEVLLEHTDGYNANCNNFYVYFNPNDNNRAHVIPWGMNYAQPVVQLDTLTEETNPLNGYLRSELGKRLSRVPKYNEQFIIELQRLIDEVWDEDNLISMINQMAAQVQSAQIDTDYENHIDELKNWVWGRRAQVELLIEQGLPEGNRNPPRTCFF
ncbi:MAG: CotH kinase family protein [Bacteroidia bacterium]